MIYQISPIQAKTQAITPLSKGLIQARHIQARLKEIAHQNQVPERQSLLPANSWFD